MNRNMVSGRGKRIIELGEYDISARNSEESSLCGT
jgi:hypothetical protein